MAFINHDLAAPKRPCRAAFEGSPRLGRRGNTWTHRYIEPALREFALRPQVWRRKFSLFIDKLSKPFLSVQVPASHIEKAVLRAAHA
jgi:hypothetical protein